MTRSRIMSALAVLVFGVAVLYAQEQQQLRNIIVTDVFMLGAGVPLQMEGTTADAFEFRWFVDPTEDIMWQGPNAAGTAGTQLQTSGVVGGEVLTWASAGSSRAFKKLEGYLDPEEALQAVVKAPIHKFHYDPDAKNGVTTGDYDTQYAGPVAEETPWAMHHNGKILNEVNTVGYTMAAIQAQQQQIEALKAALAALKARR